ncbi:toll-like receptor 13 [Anopheles gambiae]|uniref:toll-like receptor 13 n=1 Tax=Anopheles gambiae TaxID=7165 RepID=UPI002AC9B403|nr:toll-like receptor 13 [Anopheles gambiae]
MYFSVFVLFIRPTIPLRFHCDRDFICKIWHWRPLDEGAFVLDHIPITHGAIELYNFWTTEVSSNLFADFETQRRNIHQMQTALTVIRSPLRSFVLEDNATFYTIDLEKTQLDVISFGTRCNVETLKINYCKLKQLPESISNLKALKIFTLSHSFIQVVDLNLLAELPRLTLLDLSKNRLHTLYDSSAGTATLSYPLLADLYLRENKLKHINLDVFRPMESLTRIDLSHNQISVVSGSLVSASLNLLDLSNNRIVEMDCCGWAVPMLYGMDANDNRLRALPKCLEQAFLNVVRLAFDSNQLQPDVMFQFGRLTSLKFLTLTDNKLPYVTLNMSTISKQLRHLNLSHNKLKHLDVPYAPSKDFHIDVSSNCISSVDWDRVSANLTKLGMGENPLDCSFHSISTRADIRSKLVCKRHRIEHCDL